MMKAHADTIWNPGIFSYSFEWKALAEGFAGNDRAMVSDML
jgi:hypothetical protein